MLENVMITTYFIHGLGDKTICEGTTKCAPQTPHPRTWQDQTNTNEEKHANIPFIEHKIS